MFICNYFKEALNPFYTNAFMAKQFDKIIFNIFYFVE